MKPLYTSQQIQTRISELGEQISKDYEGQSVLVLGVLKGCAIFMSHLLVELKGDYEIDFMAVSSYGAGTSSGELQIQKEPSNSVAGKTVLLVEDIIDSGKTVRFVKDYLLQHGAASVKIVTFVDKETETNVLNPKYVGFKYAEPNFLVGFGFDLAEKYRNLPEVYQLEPSDLN